MKRIIYEQSFKIMIVELLNSGRSAKSIGAEYNLNINMIYRWRREYQDTERPSFTGNGNTRQTDHEKEVARLHKVLKDVTEERDILKKAVGIFSKKDRKSTDL